MKNNKGITLTSLVIYIAVIFVVIAALMRITTHFSNNMNDAADVSFETEFQKINLYLLDEAKKSGNAILEIAADGTQITFSKGNKYTYNAEEKIIYLNDTIKVCEGVERCLFEQKTAENGKSTIVLTIAINETAKTAEYVMTGGEQETGEVNIQEYLWGESLLNYYLDIGHYVDYTPDANSYTVAAGDTGSGASDDQTLSTQIDEETTEEVDEALKWRVLSINKDNVELISENATTQKLTLKGVAAYNHGVDILNDLCEELYSNSNGAVARSLNADDLNEISGYDYTTYVDSSTGYKYGDLIQMSTAGTSFMKYPNLYPLEQGNAPGGVVQLGLKSSERYSDSYKITGYTDSNVLGDDMYVTYNYYEYNVEEEEGYKGPSYLIRRNTTYWVATRYVLVPQRVYFGIYSIGGPRLGTSSCYMSSSGSEYEQTHAIRPVVTVPVELFDFSVGDGSEGNPWEMK